MLPPLRVACVSALAVVAACSRHDRPAVVGSLASAPTEPVYLDAPLRVPFDAALDAATLTADTAELVAVDGPGVGAPVRGTWRIARSVLEFVPELAHTEPVATGGGLQRDTRYELRVRGDGQPAGLRALDGRPVASVQYAFATRAGSSAAELFGRDPQGGPRLVAAEVAPQSAAGDWQLRAGFAPSTMQLRFDQPLHPGDVSAAPSPFALDYDDPVYGAGTAIDVDVELLQNTTEGALVQLRLRGVLPSRAVVRLQVAATLRDLFGEDNAGAAAEPPRWFPTEPDDTPRHDALVFDLATDAALAAPDFAEVPAVVQDGALRVPDAFPTVAADVGDWVPVGAETLLDTDTQELVFQNGAVHTFTGGVLQMRNLHIPAGFTVRGHGPNPLVLVVDGDATIDGTLSVDGADAEQVGWPIPFVSYRGPGDFSPPAVAGIGAPPQSPSGVPGGTAGGRGGSAGLQATDQPSAAGGSALGVVDGGGRGGAPFVGSSYASGGGGGGASVQGDPWFPVPAGTSGAYPQRLGIGGAGDGGALPGGEPGTTWFRNGDSGDDFWGRAYIPLRARSVVGELTLPRGGSGGASGGSWASSGPAAPPNGLLQPGGAGGGGGGVLVLQVRGRLRIGPAGRVSADGGNGGGRDNPPLAYRSFGGGGGGGSVVLMAGTGIELHVHGETFANRDYDFCVSADGGVCAARSLGGGWITSKYPANGEQVFSGDSYDIVPLGGFGGMGLVQLMVPVGSDNADGTNTVLDDAITVVRNGVPLTGSEKQRYLGWRGFADENGVLVDDHGLPTGTIGGQGDIRPDPVLLPVPWSTSGTARARSEWRPLGALHRRALAVADNLPRGVVGEPSTFGAHAQRDGWLPYGDGQLWPGASGGELLPAPAAIAAIAIDTATLGRPVLALGLAQPLPEPAPGSYTGCLADLGHAAGGSWARRRVLSSTAHMLFVDGDLALPDGVDRVRLVAAYADLATPEPGSYVGAGGVLLPRANARIGFAFHRDPANALPQGVDADRCPQQVGTFLYDLTEPAVRAAIRAFGPRAVQWDVLLDGAWRSGPADLPPPADAGSAIALRRFVLPVVF